MLPPTPEGLVEGIGKVTSPVRGGGKQLGALRRATKAKPGDDSQERGPPTTRSTFEGRC